MWFNLDGLSSIERNLSPALLDVGPAGFGLEAAFDGAFRRLGFLARGRQWFGGLGDKRDQPLAGVFAITLMDAETIGLDQDIAVLGALLPG